MLFCACVWIVHVCAYCVDHIACYWCMFEICCVLQGMISGYPPVLPPLQGPVDGIVSMGSMQPLHPGVPPPHQLPPGMPGIPGIPPPGKSLILIPPWFHCHVLGLTHSYRSSCSLFCSCLWFVSTAEYEGCAEHWTTACPLSPQDKGAGEMWCCSSRSFVPAKITLIVL